MQLGEADAWVLHHIGGAFFFDTPERIGVAVSGGSDSMALLHLLAHIADDKGFVLEAATVNHGLREEAAEEAAFVGETCKGLGVRHEVLHWADWDGSGNLQAMARSARYSLLAKWAGERALETVALGHTQDDQAETFLMRLKREAGVDGLAAMQRKFTRNGATFIRPALPLERQELRGFLTRHGLNWRNDPSNDDAKYDRVRMRAALDVLEELGIDRGILSGVAQNMASAASALETLTAEKAKQIVQSDHGDLVFDRMALMMCPLEIQRRLQIAALAWLTPENYPPRRMALFDLDRAVISKTPHTLRGCYITTNRDEVRFSREYQAVRDTTCAPDQLWDGRWQATGRDQNCEVRALGDAVNDIPNWRETGLPRETVRASPSIWQGDRLIAAPLAGFSNGWSVKIHPDRVNFITTTLSH